jgi:hypothetical protein
VRDGGRPSEAGLQEQVSNHLERRWLKTVVVNVNGKGVVYASGRNQEGEQPVNHHSSVEIAKTASKPGELCWPGMQLVGDLLTERAVPGVEMARA